jgi:copper chaperone
MLEFTIEDMTCGHCVATITKAVREVAPDAEVDIDLGQHRVRIDDAADAVRIEEAIRDAGYTPVRR